MSAPVTPSVKAIITSIPPQSLPTVLCTPIDGVPSPHETPAHRHGLPTTPDKFEWADDLTDEETSFVSHSSRSHLMYTNDEVTGISVQEIGGISQREVAYSSILRRSGVDGNEMMIYW